MDKEKLTITLRPNLSIDLIFVEGGEFLMGDDRGRKDDNLIKINSFYMAKFQLTQDIWEELMGNNPSRFKGAKRPVESISWHNVQVFIKELHKETGQQFRLPMEAEWEYAAKGGKYSQGYTYAGSDKLKQVGWYDENSGNETHEVGLLLANELGLYDMSGNVFEWCEDDVGAGRVLRGGSCFGSAVHCRVAYRDGAAPGYRLSNFGFRLVLPLQSVG